jgi:hypothetical protein
MGAGRQAEVGSPLRACPPVPLFRALCAAKRQDGSYRAQQSDDRAGIEETWLGDKAEMASRPAVVLAR